MRLFIANLILVGLIGTTTQESFADSEFFEARIRPILVNHCLDCHGEDDPAGGLRLDLKSGWQRGGKSGPAIVPGDPTSSLIIRAVSGINSDLRMPPADTGDALTDRQITDLTRWIRQGAADPRDGHHVATEIETAAVTHWALQPVHAPDIPGDAHPIDYLIDAHLQDQGFVATAPADARTLIRRAYFDLHGLPPTAEQIQYGNSDVSVFIRQLLDSPRYGERWGRHWLDVARYSDAKDGVLMYGDARIRPFAYSYRDYVIRSFNEDKPFDQFIREQLAADQLQLPSDSPALAGMGLLTLGRMFDNNRHDIIDDQIDVVSRGFLGLTVSCARCHDHKFDPVPTADYYSLYGIFASCIEPLERPRIDDVTEQGRAFEEEFSAKLNQVRALRQQRREETLKTARDRTPDYLEHIVTTEPDISETTIFFLSLIPEQLRPGITWRWRQLIARRNHADDPIFGPWHDMMRHPELTPDEWRARGIDPRVIDGRVAANPKSATEIARAYGAIIRTEWDHHQSLNESISTIDAELAMLEGDSLSLCDVVAGGNGFGTGQRDRGIHPGTGMPATGETGFIPISRFDELTAVPSSRYIDGVFIPKTGTSIATSTGIAVSTYRPSTGKTWDYFKFGSSAGGTVNQIDGVDYGSAPNEMLALHANKGITFDIQAMRDACEFQSARFQALLGHAGAKDESKLDVAVYVDGNPVMQAIDFSAQSAGQPIDIELPEQSRFLTLLVVEGAQGISHDQAILGNPRIVPDRTAPPSKSREQRIARLQQNRSTLQSKLNDTDWTSDPLKALLMSRESPVWFPPEDIHRYLSRQQNDAFRGLVNELDAIAVKHPDAADRAMTLVDSEVLCAPVIFQRGDPAARGAPVPRQFLGTLTSGDRQPFATGSGRLDLANEIASPENPLTARVWVNRVWMHHFGEPLVENPGDFGLRTSQPVYHELLDFLAAFFVQNGWRTKPLHELIMTSKAWQRTSLVPESKQSAQQLRDDPTNGLVWHANRRRLDLEQMRDSVLMVSDQLDEDMFGRPMLINDSGNVRRTVYAFVERQNLPAIVQTFDFASADTSTSRRVTTTVPQQALFAMNSPFMSQAARSLAAEIAGTDAKKVQHLYRKVLGRDPDQAETDLGITFLESGSAEQLAQVLLMSNEFMFVD